MSVASIERSGNVSSERSQRERVADVTGAVNIQPRARSITSHRRHHRCHSQADVMSYRNRRAGFLGLSAMGSAQRLDRLLHCNTTRTRIKIALQAVRNVCTVVYLYVLQNKC